MRDAGVLAARSGPLEVTDLGAQRRKGGAVNMIVNNQPRACCKRAAKPIRFSRSCFSNPERR
jgi:hypothetical protein